MVEPNKMSKQRYEEKLGKENPLKFIKLYFEEYILPPIDTLARDNKIYRDLYDEWVKKGLQTDSLYWYLMRTYMNYITLSLCKLLERHNKNDSRDLRKFIEYFHNNKTAIMKSIDPMFRRYDGVLINRSADIEKAFNDMDCLKLLDDVEKLYGELEMFRHKELCHTTSYKCENEQKPNFKKIDEYTSTLCSIMEKFAELLHYTIGEKKWRWNIKFMNPLIES